MLHLACTKGYNHFVQELLVRGANGNVRDRSGFTALHFAAMFDQYEVAADLLSRPETNAALSTSDGLTAYDLAAMTNNNELIALCDPWSWTQSLGRSTRSNSVGSQASSYDAVSLSSDTASRSASESDCNSDVTRGRVVRAQGVATQPSSRAASPALGKPIRRRSSISQLDLGTESATIEDLKQFAALSKEQEAADGKSDHQTIAQQIAQLQQSWVAFLTATSPAWVQKVTGAQSLQERFKNSAQMQQLSSMPPLMAFQAMLPTMPHLPSLSPSKDAESPDATWLGNLVSSLGAPPTYAEATAAIPLLGAMTSRGKTVEAEARVAEADEMDCGETSGSASSAVLPSVTAPGKRPWWPSKRVTLRQQSRIVDLTPAQQRAQAKRFQKPCDRMMLLFWLPCLAFFILLSVFKVTFGRVLSWV
ncbi:hypothetical protein BCR37DRAFT_378203, partial [Protomyces lactucae-debilis]